MTTSDPIGSYQATLANEAAPLQERLDAAWALGGASDDRAVEPLVQALADRDDNVRTAAAQALGRIGSPQATEGLLRLLGDTCAHVRMAAAWALGQIRDLRAQDALSRAADDPNRIVRMFSLHALGGIEGAPSSAALGAIEARLNDASRSVRLAAAQVLEKLGQAGALLSGLRDPEWEIRLQSVEGLGRARTAAAVDPLVAVVLNPKENDLVRARAAWALGQIGDRRAVEALRSASAGPGWGNRMTRDAAAEAIQKLEAPASKAPPLAMPLKPPGPWRGPVKGGPTRGES